MFQATRVGESSFTAQAFRRPASRPIPLAARLCTGGVQSASGVLRLRAGRPGCTAGWFGGGAPLRMTIVSISEPGSWFVMPATSDAAFRTCCLLVGAGEGAELCVLIVSGEKRDADRGAGTAIWSSSPVSTAGGVGASSPRRPLGQCRRGVR